MTEALPPGQAEQDILSPNSIFDMYVIITSELHLIVFNKI